MSRSPWISVVSAVLAAAPVAAVAQDAPTEPAYEPPPAPVVLQVIPARFTWDFGVSVSYGQLPQFPDGQAWAGFGARGGWGRHWLAHRVGVNLSITLEGPIGIQWANNFEPAVTYDWRQDKGLLLGASLGPNMALNVDTTVFTDGRAQFDYGAFAALRIGFSQPFSAVARRFWVYVEPKVRVNQRGEVAVLGAIVLGTGNGS